MKFLLDMPISPKVAEWLKKSGHDAVHARDIGLSKAPDALILKWSSDDKRILLTMDLDFPAILSMTQARQPGVVLFRMRHPSTNAMQDRLERLFQTHKEAVITSSITIIEDGRI